ncbi:MAG: M14 family metallopeptidase [Vulcanimicrobiota bacterium]
MELRSVSQDNKTATNKVYTFTRSKNSKEKVHADHFQEASEIDRDKNHHLSDKEIKSYLRKKEILRDPKHAQVNERKLIKEYKLTLQNKPLPQVKEYHSYQSLTDDMKELTQKHPDLCDMISLGKSHEGRDIWALKVSSKKKGNGEPKNGVLITGVHHAREWISLEVPFHAAKSMLENYNSDPVMKQRVDNVETWFVPMVNPDGYEHSRISNPWWRKNRQPITYTACDVNKNGNIACQLGDMPAGQKGEPLGTGVDLNRNYWDGNPDHLHLYRPAGDDPCSASWFDDQGASDRIASDTYRGPEGGREKEVKALIDFQLKNKNIKAAIDFHSYGRMVLYPWGATHDDVENENDYVKIGQRMANVISDTDNSVKYKVMQSADLYPATGSSEDFQYVNGIMGFTLELSDSFAPDEKDIEPTCRRLLGAQMCLVDHVMENGDNMRLETPKN